MSNGTLSTDLHQHADWINQQPTAADVALPLSLASR